MSEPPIVHAIIPARGGSKGIPRKNLAEFRGHPLIAHSIRTALKSEYISRVVVSTDDEEIAQISAAYGAEVPFQRPTAISGDLATDYEFFAHYLKWMETHEPDRSKPDILVQLRPTFPNRDVAKMDAAIKMLIDAGSAYSSLRTVVPVEKSPYKMYSIDAAVPGENVLVPLFEKVGEMTEPYNMPRQVLPPVYLHNGCLDIIWRRTIEGGSVSGERMLPWIMKHQGDIDTQEDLDRENDNHI